MQMTIYYKDEDQYLIERIDELANRRRMSKSAMVLSILEEYLEAEKSVGEILRDMGAIDSEELRQALSAQEEKDEDKQIGEIMIEKGYVKEDQLQRALQVQKRKDTLKT